MRKLLFVASAIGQANAEAWLCLVVAVGCVGGWRGGGDISYCWHDDQEEQKY